MRFRSCAFLWRSGGSEYAVMIRLVPACAGSLIAVAVVALEDGVCCCALEADGGGFWGAIDGTVSNAITATGPATLKGFIFGFGARPSLPLNVKDIADR